MPGYPFDPFFKQFPSLCLYSLFDTVPLSHLPLVLEPPYNGYLKALSVKTNICSYSPAVSVLAFFIFLVYGSNFPVFWHVSFFFFFLDPEHFGQYIAVTLGTGPPPGHVIVICLLFHLVTGWVIFVVSISIPAVVSLGCCFSVGTALAVSTHSCLGMTLVWAGLSFLFF